MVQPGVFYDPRIHDSTSARRRVAGGTVAVLAPVSPHPPVSRLQAAAKSRPVQQRRHCQPRQQSRLGVQLEAHEWATRIGFDKLPKSIQEIGRVAAYRAHLKVKLESLDAAEAAVSERLQSERTRARAESGLELQDSTLRTNVTRHQQVYDATVKRLQEIRLTRDSGRVMIHIVSAPKATRS